MDETLPILSDAELLKLRLDTRAKYVQEPPKPSKVRAIFNAIVNVVSTLFGKYARQPIVFDASSYQGDSKGNSGVDIDALSKNKEFAGMYFKMGEVGSRGSSFTQETDAWMDLTFMPNYNKMLAHPELWRAAYQYHNSTWIIDRGMTDGSLDTFNTGKDDDEHAMNLCTDPNVFLWVRRLLRLGRVWTGPDMKAKVAAGAQLSFDALVIDLEKWYNNRGLREGDYTLFRALQQTIKGLLWLMAHGYLAPVRILIYSSEWFLREYGNVYCRNYILAFSTIAAGYYFNPAKDGICATTFQGMLDKIAQIPDSWQPYNIGAGVPGEKVAFYQISGDYFTIPEVCSEPGKRSALDVNVFNGTFAEMMAFFPTWSKRVANPPVDKTCPIGYHWDDSANGCVQDPPQIETKKVVVNNLTSGLNVRSDHNTLAATKVYSTMPPGQQIDIDMSRVIYDDGKGEIWAPIKVTLDAWVAVKHAGGSFGEIKDVPK